MLKSTSRTESQTFPNHEGIRVRTLAYVNFGLFRELLKGGTSRERICATLSLNDSEYEYLAHLQQGSS